MNMSICTVLVLLLLQKTPPADQIMGQTKEVLCVCYFTPAEGVLWPQLQYIPDVSLGQPCFCRATLL